MDGKVYSRLGEVSEIANRHSPSHQTTTGDLDKSVIGQLFGMMRLSYPNFLTNKSDDEIAKIKRLWYVHLNGSNPKHEASHSDSSFELRASSFVLPQLWWERVLVNPALSNSVRLLLSLVIGERAAQSIKLAKVAPELR